MIINREIIKKIYIYAQSAEPVPPLGTILSNLGADTKIFCTQFNNKTLELPTYLLLKTTITIATNKSTSFTIDLPSTTSILALLQFEKIIKVRVYDRWHEKKINCVSLYSCLQLAKLKFPYLPLSSAFSIIKGTTESMQLIIIE